MKRSLENRSHVRAIGLGRDMAAQQITAVRVGHGKRIAPRTIRSAKPPFEIGTPGLVGGINGGEWLPIRRRADPQLPAMCEAGALQHFANRAFGRPRDVRIGGGEFHPQLSRPPLPALAHRDDMRDDLAVEPAWAMLRRATAVGESDDTLGVMPLQPLVNGFAR